MNINSINYNKTIENHSLVYKGQKSERTYDLLTVIFPLFISLDLFKNSFPEILDNNPQTLNYVLAFLFPVIAIILGLYMIQKVFNRNQLKEINYKIDLESSETLIYETAKIINWELIEKGQKIIIFKTDIDPLMVKQYITFIITPNDKILFNSKPMKHFVFGYRRARFNDNFINFYANFQRLEQTQLQPTTVITNNG